MNMEPASPSSRTRKLGVVSHDISSGEATRRYYTTKEFYVVGVPAVFSPLTPQLDTKFFDPHDRTPYRGSPYQSRSSFYNIYHASS